MKHLLLYSLLMLTSCAGLQQAASIMTPEKLYEKDMLLTVNGVTREGTISMPLKDKNQIRVVARGDLDTFVMVDCIGIHKKENAWTEKIEIPGGLFGWGARTIDNKRAVAFDYYPPVGDIAQKGSCALNVYGFSKAGEHSEGMIDWQTPDYKLGGTMICNGVKRDFEGVEICQSQRGLYQQLDFNEEVSMSPSEPCKLDKTEGKSFSFRMPSGPNGGICTYRIKGKSGAVGKLTLYGTTDILIRDAKGGSADVDDNR